MGGVGSSECPNPRHNHSVTDVTKVSVVPTGSLCRDVSVRRYSAVARFRECTGGKSPESVGLPPAQPLGREKAGWAAVFVAEVRKTSEPSGSYVIVTVQVFRNSSEFRYRFAVLSP